MRVRIIKSDDCFHCGTYIPRLRAAGLSIELFDGDEEGNQVLLDEWKIGLIQGQPAYPVVQILSDDGKVLHQFPRGTFSPRAIRHKIKEKESDNRPE